MAKSSFEKALEKQQKEAKRLADKKKREDRRTMEDAARRERASSIINGQPMVGNMRMMDASAEEVLHVILENYEENENRYVSGDESDFPPAYQSSIRLELEKLSMYGMISNPQVYVYGNWELTLTLQGISYFEDKEKAKENASVAAELQKRSTSKKYDVFISHANKDKSEYVDLLYMALKRLGVTIFYDTEVLSWGDNWKQVILDGTATSEFAIIVISENFFDREWTEKELHEFLERQNSSGQKIVLPLLHNITLDQLKGKYPVLGDIQVIDSGRFSKEEITILFAKELIKRYKEL